MVVQKIASIASFSPCSHGTTPKGNSDGGINTSVALCVFVLLVAVLLLKPTNANALPVGWTGGISSHSQVYIDSMSPQRIELSYREAARSDARYIRVDVNMNSIFHLQGEQPPEVERGQQIVGFYGGRAIYANWQKIDLLRFIDAKYEQMGRPVKTLGIFLLTPRFLSTKPSAPNYYLYAPRDPQVWANLATAIVRRQPQLFDAVEIWNEPDGDWVWKSTPEEYARMLMYSYWTIKGVNKELPVLNGGWMSVGSADFLRRAARELRGNQVYDAINVHIRPERAGLTVPKMRNWRDELAKYGFVGAKKLPLWVTEYGYPSGPAFCQDKGYQGERGQALFLYRELLAGLRAEPNAEFFVTLRDSTPTEANLCQQQEGIVNMAPDSSSLAVREKPGLFAVVAAQNQFQAERIALLARYVQRRYRIDLAALRKKEGDLAAQAVGLKPKSPRQRRRARLRAEERLLLSLLQQKRKKEARARQALLRAGIYTRRR